MGRPLYSEQAQITAVSRKSVEKIEIKLPANDVLPGNTEQVLIFSDQGTFSQIKNLRVYIKGIPSGTGTHSIYAVQTTAQLFAINSGANQQMLYQYNQLSEFSDNVLVPNDIVLFDNIVKGVVFDDVVGVKLIYKNSDDTLTKVPESAESITLLMQSEIVGVE